MKISSDAVKRLLLIAVAVGLFELYDVAKEHSLNKPQAPMLLAYIPPNPQKQKEWLEKHYEAAVKACTGQAQDKIDPYLSRYANIYQEQLTAVKVDYSGATEQDRARVAQNYFYTIITQKMQHYIHDHYQAVEVKYSAFNITKVLKANPDDPLLNAAMHQFGKEDARQKDSHLIAQKKAEWQKKIDNVRENYANLPSVALIKILLINRFSNDERDIGLKDKCFYVLANYPSTL